MPQTIERPAAAGEVPFGLDEIFYSRTDHRGIIQAGNDVFQRVWSRDRLARVGGLTTLGSDCWQKCYAQKG